jgi:hypothetical protein
VATPPAPTTVHVPIRIRIGRDTDVARLSEAIANSTGNQLGRAADVLDEQRGEWQGNLTRFDVQFKGDAAGLPPDRQRDIRASVSNGVVKGTQIAQARRGKAGARGKRKAKKGRTDDKKKPKDATKFKAIAKWIEFDGPTDPGIVVAFKQAVKAWWAAKGTTSVPKPYGMLLRLKGEPAVQLWVVHNGRYACQIPLTVMVWSGATPTTKPLAKDPDLFGLFLQRVDNGFSEYRESAIRNRSTQRAKALEKEGEVTVQPGGAEEAEKQWTADTAKVIDDHMRGWETAMRVYYRLHGLGGTVIYPFREDAFSTMPIESRIELFALAEIDWQEVLEAEDAEDAADGFSIPELPDPSTGGGAGGNGDGGGGADQGGGLGSDVTAPPGQDVGEGGRGVVIAPAYDTRGSIFPLVFDPKAKAVDLPCEPFRDEPPVWMLPGGGDEMRRLIARIAARLDMDPCAYAANFCLQAARMMRIRASQVQKRFTLDVSGDFHAELSVGATDREGRFYFRGVDSVAVQYLQHLAATIPLLRNLIRMVEDQVYPVTTFPPHHWLWDLTDEATQACGFIWLSANQVMMQQLLTASRKGVLQRKGNAEYARVFAVLCKTRLADQAELLMLRTALQKFVATVGDRKGADAYAHVREQLQLEVAVEGLSGYNVDVRKQILLERFGLETDLVTRLSDTTEYVFQRGESAEARVSDAGSIVESTDGRWVIRASDGELYDKDQLTTMIDLGQKVTASIDPIINQILSRLTTEIPRLVAYPAQIPDFLDKLFTQMLAKNDEVSRKNKEDIEYAFEHAQIHKVDRNTPATVELGELRLEGWALGGIHALAHMHVGVHFRRDRFYVAAVARLISQEYYWRSFAEDMVFIFGTVFTIICPPLGAALSFVASLALGLEAHAKAKEQEAIHGALLHPDEVLDYAEIQIDLFLAKLQISLSFLEVIPYGGKGVKALSGLGRRAAREGAGRGLRTIAKEAVMAELERIAKVSAENFVKALAIEMAEEAVEDKIVDIFVVPIIEDYIKQLEQEIEEGRQ